MIERHRLLDAFTVARADLLAQRGGASHWTGELASSALSTATAVSALALVERHHRLSRVGDLDEAEARRLEQLITGGLRWLVAHQNADGGWGDTDRSHSNVATTMLAMAAFHLTGVPAQPADLMARAQAYLDAQGGVAAIRRRYGRDKTFAVPILTNAALAGLVPWNKVSPLPFELACLPQSWYRLLRLPVVSYAIPALVAIGQARYAAGRPLNPLARLVRKLAQEPSLRVLERMQPASGGFLEAIPLTSFVVMSLAATGKPQHRVVQQGLAFLRNTVRADGSWPIDTNLATWNTSLAIQAVHADGRPLQNETACLEWLLRCQHQEVHPYTGAEPGGWGWSDLSGAVPDADDTSAALLALRRWYDGTTHLATRRRLVESAAAGVGWLLDLQNRDGGWPTFCRGWGQLPFDRSGNDLTAHAIRALAAWRRPLGRRDLDPAIEAGFRYLTAQQEADGSWLALWFGNQDHPQENNPVYGTARVLLAYRDLDRLDEAAAVRGRDWLVHAQNLDGGWGGGPMELGAGERRPRSSVEETALALESLTAWHADVRLQGTLRQGLEWLMEAVEKKQHHTPSPIGFYFAKLWYYEKLYPLTFTVSALGTAIQALIPEAERKLTAAPL